jgi:spore coat assembly protein
MAELKIGDIVARKSYGCDVFFRVADIEDNGHEKIITLKGISYRIEADAPESDLEMQPEKKVDEYMVRCSRAAKSNTRDVYVSRN